MNMQLLYQCKYKLIGSIYWHWSEVVATNNDDAEREIKRLTPKAWDIHCEVIAFAKTSGKDVWVLK